MEKFTNSLHSRSASNIALIKYWGKHGEQLPCNPSVSLTLSQARSEATFIVTKEKVGSFDFTLEGKKREGFDSKAHKLYERICKDYPALRLFRIIVDSKNTFPHGTGIASSASGMSALAIGLLSIIGVNDSKIVSHYSRLGSGSACRSVFGQFALWGETELVAGSSDQFACPVTQVHSNFEGLCDTIVIVSGEEKSVSSSAGHSLMETHPYANRRYEVARENLRKLLSSLASGEWSTFIEVVEREALELHSMMMTGIPSYTLMTPATLDFIISFRKWRDSEQAKVAFTLDAGPNIHLIHSANEKEKLEQFLAEWMKNQSIDVSLINDQEGTGSSVEQIQ